MSSKHLEGTLCFTLVGQFLWHWALMEQAMNEAIGAALDLNGYQRYIVGKNIPFQNKIKILQASVAVSILKEEERKSIHKSLRNIARYYAKRNIIAHEMFGPVEGERGVLFLSVTANERVDLSDTF
jgi:hypothetical protein